MLRPGLVIAHIAFESYLGDIKTLIITGVNSELRRLDESEDVIDRQQALVLKRDLKAWTGLKDPLSYDSYLQLVRIISPQATVLPPSSQPQLVLKQFLMDLMRLGRKPSWMTYDHNRPPFIKGGSFRSILAMGMKHLDLFARRLEKGHEDDYILKILMRAWQNFRIHAIPWSAKWEMRVGRRSHRVVYNAWTHFGAVIVGELPRARPAENRTAQIQAHVAKTMEADADGPWSMAMIKIQDYHQILNRRVLPDDFKLPSLGSRDEHDYVAATYRHVFDRIDLEKPLHRLVLITAMIFSKQSPNLFIVKPTNIPNDLNTFERMQEFLQTLTWKSRARGGLSQQDILIVVTMIYILAFYDETSPLRTYISQHKGNLGTAWTNKHSKC
jgi:hypothetical protein